MLDSRRHPARHLFTALVPFLAIAALLPLGCRGREKGSAAAGGKAVPVTTAPRRGGTAVIATAADFGGVNELVSPETTTTLFVHRQLFLNLLEEQPDFAEHPATFAPSLARSYEWSPDHTVITLHLRENAVWSDGVPITAADVRWTWQAQIDPTVAWDTSYFKHRIRDVEAVDPHTVRIHFDGHYSTQLLDLNEGFVLPKHAWEKLPFSQWRQGADFFRQHLVTSGPFLLASWRPQEEIVLTRNPRYFDPALPRLDRVVFRVIPVGPNQVTQLLAGTVDFISQVPIADTGRVEKSPRVHLAPYWGRRYTFINWNNRRPLFADPEVRRALTLATDRQALIEALWGRFARVSSSPIVSSVWAFDRSLKALPYDPAEARRILAAKGWKDTDGDGVLDKDGKRFAFELATNQGNAEREAAVVMIQAQLKQVGIAAKPRLAEFNSIQGLLEKHDFDAYLMGWGIPTTLDLEYAFHTRSIEGSANYGCYSNPEVDRLIEEVRQQPDFAAAAPLLNRLQQIIYRDQPFTFLWEAQDVAGVANQLQDVRPNALNSVGNLKEWWIRPQ